MYSRIVRDEEYQHRLVNAINKDFRLPVRGIAPAARGFFAETWRLESVLHQRYFAKLDYSPSHQARFEASLPVVDHLRRHGIDFVPRLLHARRGQPSIRFDGAIGAVFDWVDGVNVETDDTKPAEYEMMARVYAVPIDGVRLAVETFAGDSARIVDALWLTLEERRFEGLAFGDELAALELLEPQRELTAHYAERLRHFSELCAPDRSQFHITHGDAGGNLLIDGDRHTIVDWDEVMLAPPERDAWVMACRDRPNRQWAQDLIEATLAEVGIRYTLRPERLAYYAYYQYFFYLAEILQACIDVGCTDRLAVYLSGDDTWGDAWIAECLRYADQL